MISGQCGSLVGTAAIDRNRGNNMNISKEEFLIKIPSVDLLKNKILPYRDLEKVMDKWLLHRLDTVLPKVMKRSGIDLWVVACREYNEDPVLKSLTPVAMMSARRTTVLVFNLKEDGKVARYSLSRPGVGLDGFYEGVWTNPKGANWADSGELMPFAGKTDKYGNPPETQWECLNRIIKQCNPQKIGLNFSATFAFADGLSTYLHNEIVNCLDEGLKSRITSAEDICIGWLETRTEEEMAAYTGIVQIAHALIAEAFSSKVVIPGVTTNRDVKYFMLQKLTDLGLMPWFDFEVSIRRRGVGAVDGDDVIIPGDILHCDVGLCYLGLCTDTQENAYILKQGEIDAPDELKQVMKTANRLQDIVCENFKEGRSGNEILALSRKQAIEEGIEPCIYTHPIGYHEHGAGPTIGLWDMQDGVPGQGDYPLYNDTVHALELNVKCFVESWNTTITFGAETDVLFTDNKTYYLAGRQENFHLIK